MMVKTVGRIDVWATSADAAISASEGGEALGRMSIWPTAAQARAHKNRKPRNLAITWAGGFTAGSVSEDTATTTILGTLSATDPEGGNIIFTIQSDADSKFSITGASLKLANALDYETATSHSVTIRASDPSGAYLDRTFTVTVTDVVEGGYTGPLDIRGDAVVAYSSARALSAAKRGTALYTIREDAGDTTQSFDSDAVTGEAPVAAITAFLNGANPFVATWDDQSANAAHVSNSAANQPAFDLSVIPALKSGANAYLTTSPTLPSFSSIHAFFVVSSSAGGRTIKPIDWYSSGSGFITPILSPGITFAAGSIDFDNGSDDGANEAGTTTGQWLADSSPVIVELVSSGGTPDIFVNGQAVVGTPYGNNVFGPTGIITYIDVASFGSGTADTFGWEELVYETLTGGEATAIRQNIAAYYGITLP